jgi:hypothetical protein
MTTAPKTIRLNPREAPKGYRASCVEERRKDGHFVIFKRIKKVRKP